MANIRATFSINAAGTVWGAIEGSLANQTDLANALNAKQDVITDLDTIRVGASAGATALQPNDNITQLTNNARYITSASVGNGTLTIQKNSIDVGTFSANQSANKTINITVPTTASDVGALPDTTTINDLTSTEQQAALNSGATTTNIGQITTNQNAIGTLSSLTTTAKTDLVSAINELDSNKQDNITDLSTIRSGASKGATSIQPGDNISELTNNAGYTTNVGTVTSVNNVLPVNGNVSITIPTVNNATLTIQKNGTTINTFTANASSNVTANITVPTDVSDLTNTTLSNTDLSNLSETGNNRLHALKAYSDNGELLYDAEGLQDVKNYAHSTFDLSKFTVAGNPVITDDGIASGFSVSNYLRISSSITDPITFTNSAVHEIEFTPSSITSTGNMDFIGGSFLQGLLLRQVNNELKGFISIDGTSWAGYYTIYTGLVVDTSYKIRTECSTTDTKIYVNGTLAFTNNSGKLYALPYYIGIGNFSGSIDLKQLYYEIDGVPVFSGNKTGIDTYIISGETVNIPYTWSKENNKIVNAYYRNEVTALFNMQGSAPYFTLDEENGNFTLPMGNLYGMIGQRALIDSDRNGAEYWELYSDGTIEQGGECTSGVEVTLAKPFTSAYVVTVPTSAKSLTAFTPTETGFYIAKGV